MSMRYWYHCLSRGTWTFRNSKSLKRNVTLFPMKKLSIEVIKLFLSWAFCDFDTNSNVSVGHSKEEPTGFQRSLETLKDYENESIFKRKPMMDVWLRCDHSQVIPCLSPNFNKRLLKKMHSWRIRKCIFTSAEITLKQPSAMVSDLTCALWYPKWEQHHSMPPGSLGSCLMPLLKFRSASSNQTLERNKVLQLHG